MQTTSTKQISEWIEDNYPDYEILLADGFEEAFLVVATQFNKPVAVYSRQKCIEILMKDMSEDDAHEYFEFNVTGAYVGESTPMFLEFYKSIEADL